MQCVACKRLPILFDFSTFFDVMQSYLPRAKMRIRGPPDILHLKKLRNGGHLDVRMDSDKNKRLL